MIIPNGYIRLKAKTPGTIDPATGYPSKPQGVEWDAPIPCQYLPNSRNNLGKVNGEHFSTATYTILVEEQPLPDTEQLRLQDAGGKSLGDFSLIAPPETMEAVGQIKILV